MDAISVAELERTSPLTFGRIVVIGGGCYGKWYTQQLARATRRGALRAREIVIVDRDPQCAVAHQLSQGLYDDLPIELVVDTWDNYVAHWLAAGPDALRTDTMVPSPLMPHLCLDWLVRRARDRWPGRSVEVTPLPSTPPTPWERAAPDARHYVSFATWMCPVNCIEPKTCPATRGPRDWSMPVTIKAMADREPALQAAAIFHCVHRTYGVGMIDAAAIAAADQVVESVGRQGPGKILIGTVSHCHGALGVLALS